MNEAFVRFGSGGKDGRTAAAAAQGSLQAVTGLAAYLAEVAYDEVRKAFGIAACLWAWVCAVCVICGAPLAVLPSEDPEVIRCQRAARARTRLGRTPSTTR